MFGILECVCIIYTRLTFIPHGSGRLNFFPRIHHPAAIPIVYVSESFKE